MRILSYCLLMISAFGTAQELSVEKANHLATLPIKCLQQEYPNKLQQLLIDASEIQSPKQLHPTFYGCFDWHSAVHGHWSLVYLLQRFPNLANRDLIIEKLKVNLSKENIQQEIAYLSKKHEASFERTYGWAWLLKLQLELETSPDSYAKELANNLKPLSDLIVERYVAFLPKLLYPVRAGTHTNTAFGLNFAWDYAVHTKDEAFKKVIKLNAIRLFEKDQNCPFTWEPSGTDFLSPCLEEIGTMQRVLAPKEFILWIKTFAPTLFNKNFTWEVAKVSDRTDGHLVHLDGLNFSRAWNLMHLMKQYPKEFRHLRPIANAHLQFSLPSVVDGNYEGEHWLASFALRAYEEAKEMK
jgi:Protein of unknown function (DUF2891)